MTKIARFRTETLLGASTGILMPDGGDHPIDGMYAILGHLTGRSLFTHELPQAMDMVRPELARQFPWLPFIAPERGVMEREAYVEVLVAWAAEMSAAHGAEHIVVPMPDEPMATVDPMAGMVERFGAENILRISLEG